MQTFELTRKILSWGPTYEVRLPGAEDIVLTVKGALTSRKLTLLQGRDGPEFATMAPNLLGTKFELVGANKEKIAHLAFPIVAFKKSFTLAMSGKEYKADGGFFATNFKCNDVDGSPLLEVTWEPAWKDKFLVHVHGEFPKEVAIMATVAIHQKYYENAGVNYD